MKILMNIDEQYKNKLIQDIEQSFEVYSLPKRFEKGADFKPKNLETYLRLGLVR